MAQQVYDGAHVQALYDDRGGDVIVVTFNEMEYVANGRNYWGDRPLERINISAIGILSKEKNWYPASDMKAIAAAVEPFIASRKTVLTYGFSQGAYGALKYSKLLSATHVLAFSPQFSINPSHMNGTDKRFAAHFDPVLNSNMEICARDVSGQLRVFVDPADHLDILNANAICSAAPDVVLIPCFNIGHGTVRAVASTVALTELIDCCKSDAANQRSLSLLMRKHKKPTFAYTYTLGQRAIRSRKKRLSLSLFKRARAIDPDHPYLERWRHTLDTIWGLP